MTIPSSHQDAAMKHVAAHGGQGWREVRAGMCVLMLMSHVTMYLLKKLWKEGRLEKRARCLRQPKRREPMTEILPWDVDALLGRSGPRRVAAAFGTSRELVLRTFELQRRIEI